MSQKNVLVGRARFDNEDAKGVVIFLQEGDGQGFSSAHRGWSRHELAQIVSTKSKLKMILSEDMTANKKVVTLEQLTAFSEKLNRLKSEVELEPTLYFVGGFAISAEFQWERDITELEVVAAKAYLRDAADQPVKKKSAYEAVYTSSNSLRSVGERLNAVLDNSAQQAAPPNEWNWDESVQAMGRATAPAPAQQVQFTGTRAEWITYDEMTPIDPFGQQVGDTVEVVTTEGDTNANDF